MILILGEQIFCVHHVFSLFLFAYGRVSFHIYQIIIVLCLQISYKKTEFPSTHSFIDVLSYSPTLTVIF